MKRKQVIDTIGAAWIGLVTATFLLVSGGGSEISVAILEKVYALGLGIGVVWAVWTILPSYREDKGA